MSWVSRTQECETWGSHQTQVLIQNFYLFFFTTEEWIQGLFNWYAYPDCFNFFVLRQHVVRLPRLGLNSRRAGISGMKFLHTRLSSLLSTYLCYVPQSKLGWLEVDFFPFALYPEWINIGPLRHRAPRELFCLLCFSIRGGKVIEGNGKDNWRSAQINSLEYFPQGWESKVSVDAEGDNLRKRSCNSLWVHKCLRFILPCVNPD